MAENIWPGGAIELANKLSELAGVECSSCVLWHIQRGGSPVSKDRILATTMGVAAVQAIVAGENNIMITEQNNATCYITFEQAVKNRKIVNQQLIDAQTNILALTAQNQ